MTTKKKPSYSEAIAEIEEFLGYMESDNMDIDEVSEKLKKVSFLIDVCYDKLLKMEEEIVKLKKKI
ncbi:MAG: exodeoxyribonuclease VII small subunit [Bacteroidales bacterium]|nr:exodeoxyribonuclease VII small subunit [Bacteroidales bacterium]